MKRIFLEKDNGVIIEITQIHKKDYLEILKGIQHPEGSKWLVTEIE